MREREREGEREGERERERERREIDNCAQSSIDTCTTMYSPMGIMMGDRVSLCLAEGMSRVKPNTPPWLVLTNTPWTDELPTTADIILTNRIMVKKVEINLALSLPPPPAISYCYLSDLIFCT